MGRGSWAGRGVGKGLLARDRAGSKSRGGVGDRRAGWRRGSSGWRRVRGAEGGWTRRGGIGRGLFGHHNGVFPCRRRGLEWGLVRFGHRAVFGQQEGVFPCGGPRSGAGGAVFGQRDRVFPRCRPRSGASRAGFGQQDRVVPGVAGIPTGAFSGSHRATGSAIIFRS